MRLELITTGSELMLGFTANTHPAYLGRRLADIGLRLDRHTTIADHRDEMRAAMADALHRSEIVIVTGGLGPTSDDFTRDIAADLLGLRLVRDESVAAAIEARVRRRAVKMPESLMVQALVPAGARVLPNANGTAPGLIIEKDDRLLILLPGPPRELKPMFEDHVLPLIQSRAGHAPRFECRVFKVAGLPESIVEQKIAPGLADLPDLDLGYCARPGEIDVRILTPDHAIADEAERRIRAALGSDLFGTGADRLEEIVVNLLTAAGQTVAVAESCTGGQIANRLTNVSGSSAVFLNGWVTYSNESKIRDLGVREETLKQFGAVSEQVAREMAEGARKVSRATCALSTTGIAGPTGGTPEKPVGLVYIGLATPTGTTIHRHTLTVERETFKAFVSQVALDLLRRKLQVSA